MTLKCLAFTCLILCCLYLAQFAETKTLNLKQTRMNYTQIIERNKQLRLAVPKNKHHPKNGQFFTLGMPFDGLETIFDVGTPGQVTVVRIETGITQTWLIGTEYRGHAETVYDYKNSTTSKYIGDVSYGYTGHYKLRGYSVRDVMTWFAPFNYTFDIIEEIDTDDSAKIAPPLAFGGILGFAWTLNESFTPDDRSSFIVHLLDGLENKVFTIWCQRIIDRKHMEIPQESSITFGVIDDIKCLPDLKWFPIVWSNDDAALLFRIQSFQYGSYLKKGNWFSSLDSGLSLIAFPSTIVNALSNQMPVEWDNELQLWMIDCDQAQSLDDLVFGASGTEIRVPATEYIVDILAPNNKCVAAFDVKYYDTADLGLGLPVFREFCANFDLMNNRVGLSTSIHNRKRTQ